MPFKLSTYHVVVRLLLFFLLLFCLGGIGGRSGLGSRRGDGECLGVGKVLLDLFRG